MFAVEGGTTLLDLWPFLCERVLSARWKRLPGFQCHQLPRLNLTLRELLEMFFLTRKVRMQLATILSCTSLTWRMASGIIDGGDKGAQAKCKN